MSTRRRTLHTALSHALFVPALLSGQATRPSGPIQEASRLDSQGATKEARVIIQGVIDTATLPAQKAAAQRVMAMSFAFDGDCANTERNEQLAIAYWRTRGGAARLRRGEG